MCIFAKRTTAILWVAVVLCLTFASVPRAAPPDRAAVTFSAGAGGTLTAVVDGVPIASGDSVSIGKMVVFTAFPAAGYGIAHWTVNGAAIADTSMRTFMVGISNAAPVNVTVSFERTSPCAAVTFRADGGGTVTASVDGVPIASGDSVSVGKNVAFTAFPAAGYGIARWRSNETEIVDTSMHTLMVGISNTAPVDVAVSFEKYVEPPDTLTKPLSGILTFGPSPVRSGGEVVIFWAGNKEIGGELQVFNALGDMVACVNVGGIGKIGAWGTSGVARGTYLMRGMLKDKDGFKCRVLMLVGVVK